MNLRLSHKSILYKYEEQYGIITICKTHTVKFKINKQLYSLLYSLLQLDDYSSSIVGMQEYGIDISKLHDCISILIERKAVIFTSDSRVNTNQFRDYTDQKLTRLFIEVTNSCNLKCCHCYNSKPGTHKYINLETLDNLLREALTLGVSLIDITGGEPFLHPQILEILDMCARYGMFINLYTNATLLNADIIKELDSQYPIHSIIVSLDGITSDTHEKIRGVRGIYSAVINNLKLIAESDLSLRINTMIMKDNECEVSDIINYAYHDLNATSVAVAPILATGKGKEVLTHQVSMEKVYIALDQAYSCMLAAAIEQPISDSRCTYCGVYDTTAYISSDFEVYLCPTLTKYESNDFTLGKYPADSLSDIYQSMKRFSNKFRCKQEQACAYAAQCKGGCRSRAFLTTGEIDGVDQFMCNYFARKHH